MPADFPPAEAGRQHTGLPGPIDRVLAIALLIAAAPLICLASVATLLDSGPPVLFRHERIGRGGQRFRLLKLRSMRVGAGGAALTCANDRRVTRVGRVLRSLKIDELPGLWNVICGHVSLVGPRPEAPCFVSLDDPRWVRLLRVRPGLTDPVTLDLGDEEGLLASVEGDKERFYRECLLPKKIELSLAYLEGRTWRSDLRVLWQTARLLLRGGGEGRLALRLPD